MSKTENQERVYNPNIRNDINGGGINRGEREIEIEVLYFGVTPFGGKSKLIDIINQNVLLRHYDKDRFYEHVYRLGNTLLVDLDVQPVHLFELIDMGDLKELYNKIMRAYNRNLKNTRIDRVILLGHYRLDADIIGITKFIPYRDEGKNEQMFKLRKAILMNQMDEFSRIRHKMIEVSDNSMLGIITNEISKYSNLFINR